jgi:trimethylamine--corrinoid protein Co-methyltransferase
MPRPGPAGGQYQPLAAEEIARIHHASLGVLERTGVRVCHAAAQTLYRRAGAHIEGDRITIPEKVVEAALASVPHKVLLAGRDPAQDIVLEGRRVYAGTGGSPAAVVDMGETWPRPATLRDVRELARLADALEHCDFLVVPLTPTEVPTEHVPAHRFYACVSQSGKHVMGGLGSVEGARRVRQMGVLIAGGEAALSKRPIVSGIASWMVSPLCLDPSVTDILLEWCSYGLPIALSSAPMAGATSPVTLAGTLVQLHAEQLSGIVLTQVVRPGTPVLAGYIPSVADMRSGGYVGGAIEFGMMQAAAAQLALHCGVPIYGSGGMSDSKLPDCQAGLEKMATLLLAAMGGCNYLHHAIGMVANMSATSLEQAVIDDEIVGMVMRVLRGPAVSDESLAVEAIDRVGPGGHYLMDPHTLRFLRSELFFPRLADRQGWSAWEEGGRQTMRGRARERAESLLRGHTPLPLPPEVDREIRDRFLSVPVDGPDLL